MPTLPPPITSRTNARVKELRQAFSGRSANPGELVGVEGSTLLDEAIRSKVRVDTLFVREGAQAACFRGLAGAQAQPRQTLVLSREVYDSVVDTATPQPIAATVEIPRPIKSQPGSRTGTYLLLEDVQDPGNVGTLIRSAEAFGVAEIFVTPGCANQWSPKVIRASAGSVFRKPIQRMSLNEALEVLRREGVRIAGAVAHSEQAVPSPAAKLWQPIAVLIGNEGGGLSQQALAMVDEQVNIPCQTESLNAAIAGSLLMYEAQRQNAFRSAGTDNEGRGAMSLFDTAPLGGEQRRSARSAPLADRMRPRSLDEFFGQEHLLGPGKPLRLQIERDDAASLIFWGPPGVGKTTLAKIIARTTQASFIEFSAVLSGIKEIKQVMVEAEKAASFGSRTILFIDEIHRFNKAQQDAFLPYVERGSIRLIGATTENPSFEINAALLSRCRVYTLRGLEMKDVIALLERAMSDEERGLGALGLSAEPEALEAIASYASGDARSSLNALEVAAQLALGRGEKIITRTLAAEALQQRVLLYDKKGEQHYDLISALHKSVRNSDADASLYWLGRMLQAGEDPMYVARRVVRMAVEDIGLAAPEALNLCLSARDALHFLGSPEGDLALSAGGGVSGAGAEVQRGLYGLQRCAGGHRGTACRTCAAASAKCADEADERARLRQGVPVRTRCGGQGGRYGVPATVVGGPALLPADPRGQGTLAGAAYGRDSRDEGEGARRELRRLATASRRRAPRRVGRG